MQRHFLPALLALTLFACVAFGGPPTVPKEVQVSVGKVTTFEVKVEKGKRLGWQRVFPQEGCTLVRLHSEDPDVYAFLASPNVPGQFGVAFWTEGETTGVPLVIDAGGVVPPGPIPPGPQPPIPTPDASPFPLPGLRVLIVYEFADQTKWPKELQSVVFASSVRSYLNTKCVLESDGKTRAWRMGDQNVSGWGEPWDAAMKRPRKELPWLLIGDGKKGYEGPLPKSVAEMMSLLQKFGGP